MAMAVITELPLTRASPSFGSRCSGSRPRARSASTEPISLPRTSTLKELSRPITAPAMAASGTRSPLAPMEPSSRTHGVTPLLRKTSKRRMRSMRMPETPQRSEFARRSMLARTSATGSRFPAPDLRNQSNVSCSSRASSAETAVSDFPPKPVVTPYIRSPAITSRMTYSCDACTRFCMRRSLAMLTFAEPRATRATSSMVRSLPRRVTVLSLIYQLNGPSTSCILSPPSME